MDLTSDSKKSGPINNVLLSLSFVLPWAAFFATRSRENEFLALVALSVLATLTTVGLYLWSRTVTGQLVATEIGILLGCFSLAVGGLFAICIMLLGLQGHEERLTQGLVILFGVLTWLLGAMSMQSPRNRLLGFRTLRTMKNDETWALVNRRFGRWLKILSPISLIGLWAGRHGPLVAILPAILVGVIFLLDELASQVRSRY